MIRGIKNKGLRLLFEKGNVRGIPAAFAPKIRRILLDLHTAEALPQAVQKPGYGLHALTGDRRGTWSIVVSANWRLTFTIKGTDAADVDFEDYH